MKELVCLSNTSLSSKGHLFVESVEPLFLLTVRRLVTACEFGFAPVVEKRHEIFRLRFLLSVYKDVPFAIYVAFNLASVQC